MDLELLTPQDPIVAPFRVRALQPDLRIANVRLNLVKNLGPGFQRLGIAINDIVTANAGRLRVFSPNCLISPRWIAADMPAGDVQMVELDPTLPQLQAGTHTCTFAVERVGPERDLDNNRKSHSWTVKAGQ